jgi:hypothetical protein
VTGWATRSGCRFESSGVERRELAVFTTLVERMGSTGRLRVGAARMTSPGRKSVCDSGSAPSNLQPCEHGRLVASGRKRWVLVGGNDEVHKDDDPGRAGRRLELGQTNPGHSGYYECLLYCGYILSSNMNMAIVGQCWTCRRPGCRRSAVAAWRMDVKEDPPPATIQLNMHNYDSCPRCRADGTLTQSQPYLLVST